MILAGHANHLIFDPAEPIPPNCPHFLFSNGDWQPNVTNIDPDAPPLRYFHPIATDPIPDPDDDTDANAPPLQPYPPLQWLPPPPPATATTAIHCHGIRWQRREPYPDIITR